MVTMRKELLKVHWETLVLLIILQVSKEGCTTQHQTQMDACHLMKLILTKSTLPQTKKLKIV